jgi:hypothetical protein
MKVRLNLPAALWGLGLHLIACGGDRFSTSVEGATDASAGGSGAPDSAGVQGRGIDGGGVDGGDDQTFAADSGSTMSPTALDVTSVTPNKGATQVSPTSSVSAMFARPLNAATVTKTSFTVEGGGQAIQGDVSSADVTAKLTPASPLSLLTTYTATLVGSISDLAGNTLGAPYTWSFTTADGKWSNPGVIELNAGDAELPRVAIDGGGNAIAVWAQSDGTRKNIWSNRFKPGDGWQTAELLEKDDAGDARFPRVAVDSKGNAVAVWMQSDGTHYHIRTNYYTAGDKWSAATLVENNDAGDAVTPSIAIDERGHAIAVWSQSDGNVDSMWTSRMTWADRLGPTFGWSTPELLEHDDAGNAGPYTQNPSWVVAPVKMDQPATQWSSGRREAVLWERPAPCTAFGRIATARTPGGAKRRASSRPTDQATRRSSP